MNWYGILTGLSCFLMIGIFHPIVIKCEYYFTKRIWPAFLAAGLGSIVFSLMLKSTFISILLGVLGCSCLWSIIELFKQEKRVEKGWFPRRETNTRCSEENYNTKQETA